MGDYYHNIKKIVDKMSYQKITKMKKQKAKLARREEKLGLMSTAMKGLGPNVDMQSIRNMTVSESDQSEGTTKKDVAKYEHADALRKMYKKDSTLAIDKYVTYAEEIENYITTKKMQEKMSIGKGMNKLVVASFNIDQLIDMIKRHYKSANINNEKKGKREIREMQQIFNGTLLKNPE